jgi:hypothetical protein
MWCQRSISGDYHPNLAPVRISDEAGKRLILNEFVAVTGYHRKHAIRLLRLGKVEPPSVRVRPRRYGDAARALTPNR